MFAFFGTIFYINYRLEANRETAWKKFAQINNLQFTSSFFLLSHGHISGRYRGHQLKLDFTMHRNPPYTRLVINSKARINKQKVKALAGRLSKKDIIDLLAPNSSYHGLSNIKVGSGGYTLTYTLSGLVTDITVLQRITDLLSDVGEGYPTVVALGGEAVPLLQTIAAGGHHLQNVAPQLIKDIGKQSARKWGQQASNLRCPTCLTRCQAHQVQLSLLSGVTYYGCRICSQSHKFLTAHKGVIAVLDRGMNTKWSQQDGQLRVYWLANRTLFDFDEVEIAQATDEEVERFAVQVGNDTDPARKDGYKHMQCLISTNCHLSMNTKKILRRIFGSVWLNSKI